ncbi:MAG: thioredoxin family protein [Bacteroidota bacterium]
MNLQTYIDKGITYQAYREWVDKLKEEGKTSGPEQKEDLIYFTGLNAQRMKRLDKTFRLLPDILPTLRGLEKSYIWLVITESWCGDAAQSLPILNALSKQTENIKMLTVLRDENPELMDAFLTNGTRSIPKLIIIEEESGTVAGTWGPRPAEAQDLVMAYKADPGDEAYVDFQARLQIWYTKDKGVSTLAELKEVLDGLE